MTCGILHVIFHYWPSQFCIMVISVIRANELHIDVSLERIQKRALATAYGPCLM